MDLETREGILFNCLREEVRREARRQEERGMRVLLSGNLLLVVGAVFILAFATPVALAHTDEEAAEVNIEDIILENSLIAIAIGSAVTVISVIVAMTHKTKNNNVKVALFAAISIPVIAATLFVAGGTIYINFNSATGGPVHWHADFELWKCNERVDIIDPTGITNRVGSPTLHEHNDDRIHVEGVVIDYPDVSLHSFFEIIGGDMDDTSIAVPTDNGMVTMFDGEECDGQESRFQVFVYRVLNPDDLKNWEYVQEKLEEPAEYVLSPYSIIPPGDCFIVELGEEKEKTENICETMKVAIDRGELREAQ